MSTIDEVSLLAGDGVRGYLARLEELLRATVAWSDGPAAVAAQGTLAAGGKRLRPLLCYLSASDRDGDDLARAGAAVELVHSATLVHDDVLDQAPLRRGRPTIWATGGPELAVATGDYLFARAFALLAETGDPLAVAELADCTLGLAQGEALQMLQARDARTTPEQYLERCGLKTGMLFATACALGGRLGGVPVSALPVLRRVRPRPRPRVPDRGRRARLRRIAGVDRQADRHRPARRHRDAAAAVRRARRRGGGARDRRAPGSGRGARTAGPRRRHRARSPRPAPSPTITHAVPKRRSTNSTNISTRVRSARVVRGVVDREA